MEHRDFLGSETVVFDTVVLDIYHYTFVKTHYTIVRTKMNHNVNYNL